MPTIELKQGADWELVATFDDDLTGAAVTSQARTRASAGAIAWTWEVTVNDAPAGVVTLRLDDAVTALIAPGRYEMDIAHVKSGLRDVSDPLIDVLVKPQVTR